MSHLTTEYLSQCIVEHSCTLSLYRHPFICPAAADVIQQDVIGQTSLRLCCTVNMKLPTSVLDCDSLAVFKSKLKTHLFTIYIIKGVMFVCLYLCSVWPAKRLGRSRPNLTRTHVHPGSVSVKVKVNVKVIHVCVWE